MELLTIEEVEKRALIKEKNYYIVKGTYLCRTCNDEIKQVTITFPIHDGPFAMSGSGKVERQVFPYCPTCEVKPEIKGLPITIKS